MPITLVSGIVESNGKTFKQNNLEEKHNIPLGALVEVKFDEWFGDGAGWKVHARLWVYNHDRDFDGSPLYSLSKSPPHLLSRDTDHISRFFMECELTVVEVADSLKQGEGALEWE